MISPAGGGAASEPLTQAGAQMMANRAEGELRSGVPPSPPFVFSRFLFVFWEEKC